LPSYTNWGTYPIYHNFQLEEQSNGTHKVSWDLDGYVDYGSGSQWNFTNWSDWWLTNWYSEMHLERSTDGGVTWDNVYSYLASSPDPVTSWYDPSPAQGETRYRMYWYWLTTAYNSYEKYYSPVVTINNSVTATQYPYEVYSGDHNYDGYTDLFVKVVSPAGQDITSDFLLIQNASTGEFSVEGNTSQVILNQWNLEGIAPILTDFNADGSQDLILKGLEFLFNPTFLFDQIVFADPDNVSDPMHVRAIDEDLEKFYTDFYGWLQDPNYFDNAILQTQDVLRVKLDIVVDFYAYFFFGWFNVGGYSYTIYQRYFTVAEIQETFGISKSVSGTQASTKTFSTSSANLYDYVGAWLLDSYCYYSFWGDSATCVAAIQTNEVVSVQGGGFDYANYSYDAKQVVDLIGGMFDGSSSPSQANLDSARTIIESLFGVPLGGADSPLVRASQPVPLALQGPMPSPVYDPPGVTNPTWKKFLDRYKILRVLVISGGPHVLGPVTVLVSPPLGDTYEDDYFENRDAGYDLVVWQIQNELDDPYVKPVAIIGEGEGRPLVPNEVYRVEREALLYPGGALYLPDYFRTYDPAGLDDEHKDVILRGFNSGWIFALTAFEARIEDIGFYYLRPNPLERGPFYLQERRQLVLYPLRFEYPVGDTELGSYYGYGL